ncbi:hypothetical protein GEMRC1_000712 [Eukaryota sp. GEM-RC1]
MQNLNHLTEVRDHYSDPTFFQVLDTYSYHVLHPFIYDVLERSIRTLSPLSEQDAQQLHLGVYLHACLYHCVKSHSDSMIFFYGRMMTLSLKLFMKSHHDDPSQLSTFLNLVLTLIYDSRPFSIASGQDPNLLATPDHFARTLLIASSLGMKAINSNLSPLDIFSLVLRWMMQNGHVQDHQQVLALCKDWFVNRNRSDLQVRLFSDLITSFMVSNSN